MGGWIDGPPLQFEGKRAPKLLKEKNKKAKEIRQDGSQAGSLMVIDEPFGQKIGL